MELVVNASNSITPTLPMICLIWESKARDQRKSAFFLLSLFVCRISIYASNFHLTYDFFLLLFFCFWMWTYDLFEVWKKKRISLSRKIWCFFLFCPYFERERERTLLILDSVYCIDIFGCIYGLFCPYFERERERELFSFWTVFIV